MRTYTLGIDLGSSFLKAAVFCLEERRVVWQHSQPTPPRLEGQPPEYFELDADRLFSLVKEMVDTAAAQFGIVKVLFSTQMHGFVYRTPGRADRYVSWQDSRSTLPLPQGKTALEILQERFGQAGEGMLCSGVAPKPGLGLCNLYALLHLQSLPADGMLFTLGSYLIFRFTGNNVCHLTNAAPLGLADVPGGRWNLPLLQAAGLAEISLPRIAPADFTVCGVYETAGRTVSFTPDYGDQQVSILGAAPGPEDAVVNIATACQISRTTRQFCPGKYEIRPYFEGQYINTVSGLPSGRNLAVLIDFLQQAVQQLAGVSLTAAEIWAGVQRQYSPNTRGLQADLLFYPTSQQLEGGSLSHIRPDNLRLSCLFSAAYEDMAQTYRRILPQVCGGTPPQRLVCSGGVSWRNPALLETIARRTGVACVRSAMKDEALNGLYRLSLAATGQLQKLSDQPENVLLSNEEKENVV